jgi:hypothetical protein
MLVQNAFVCKSVDYGTRQVVEVPCLYPSLKVTSAAAGQSATSLTVLPNKKVPITTAESQYQVQALSDPKHTTDADVVIAGDTQTTSSYAVLENATVRFSSSGITLKPTLANACNSKTELPAPTQASVIVAFENRTGYTANIQFSNAANYGPNTYDCNGSNAFPLGPRDFYQYLATKTASFVVTVTDAFGIKFSSPVVVPYGNPSKLVIPFKNDLKKAFAVMTVPPMADFTPADRSRYPNGIMNVVLNSIESKDYLFKRAFVATSSVESMPGYQIALLGVFSLIAAAGLAALAYTALRKKRAQ